MIFTNELFHNQVNIFSNMYVRWVFCIFKGTMATEIEQSKDEGFYLHSAHPIPSVI